MPEQGILQLPFVTRSKNLLRSRPQGRGRFFTTVLQYIYGTKLKVPAPDVVINCVPDTIPVNVCGKEVNP